MRKCIQGLWGLCFLCDFPGHLGRKKHKSVSNGRLARSVRAVQGAEGVQRTEGRIWALAEPYKNARQRGWCSGIILKSAFKTPKKILFCSVLFCKTVLASFELKKRSCKFPAKNKPTQGKMIPGIFGTFIVYPPVQNPQKSVPTVKAQRKDRRPWEYRQACRGVGRTPTHHRVPGIPVQPWALGARS